MTLITSRASCDANKTHGDIKHLIKHWNKTIDMCESVLGVDITQNFKWFLVDFSTIGLPQLLICFVLPNQILFPFFTYLLHLFHQKLWRRKLLFYHHFPATRILSNVLTSFSLFCLFSPAPPTTPPRPPSPPPPRRPSPAPPAAWCCPSAPA